MKRILVLLVMLTPVCALAQGPPQIQRQYTFTSATTQPAAGQGVSGLGYGYYKLKWEVINGTLSACTVSLQGDNGQQTWGTNIIANQTCTSDGETSVTAAGTVSANFRVNVSSFTQSSQGAAVIIHVSAWNEVTGASASNPIAIAASGTLVQGASVVMTATTSTVVIAAVANQYLYIQSCHMSNTHASTDTLEVLQAGSGGTALNGVGDQNPHGFGNNLIYPSPLKVTPIGTALFVANVTTGSNTYVNCQGFSSPNSY